MALPISLYDPMVVLEAAATFLTGCYILRLAFWDTVSESNRVPVRAERGAREHAARNRQLRTFAPHTLVIAPAAPLESSLPVLSALPMRAPSKLLRTRPALPFRVAQPSLSAASIVERDERPAKIVSIESAKPVEKSSSKRTSLKVAARQHANKVQQTDWLQRA